MEVLMLGIHYFEWHYSHAIRNISDIGNNFIWFLVRFFSIRSSQNIAFFQDNKSLKAFLKGVAQIFLRFLSILCGIILIIGVVFAEAAIIIFWLLLPPVLLFVLFVSIESLSQHL